MKTAESEAVVCQNCGKPNEETAQFCIYCGACLEEKEKTGQTEKTEIEAVVCQNCGKSNEETAQFCVYCGACLEEKEKTGQTEQTESEAAACQNCGKSNEETAQFCIYCGACLEEKAKTGDDNAAQADQTKKAESEAEISDEDFKNLCNKAKNGTNQQRRDAISALGKINTQAATDVLLDIINDYFELYDMVCAALRALGKRENKGKGISLNILYLYSQSPNETVKLTCVAALAWIADIEMVDPLIDILKYGPDAEKSNAAYGLAEIGVVPAVNALFDAYNKYKNTDNTRVLSGIISALGSCGDIRANTTLVNALNHSSSYIRLGAAEKLARIKDTAIISLLKEKLDDSDLKVRAAIAAALVNQGDSSGYPVLLQAAEKGDKEANAAAKRLIDDDALAAAPDKLKQIYMDD